jgi:hypothetical protein
MKRLFAAIVICALAAFAADISGNWKATAEGPQGNLERTFTFKADGAKLTGETTSTMLGKSTITDGKIDGDNISFSITASMQGNEMKISYKGKVSGSEIHLTSEVSGGAMGGQAIQWVLKKQ